MVQIAKSTKALIIPLIFTVGVSCQNSDEVTPDVSVQYAGALKNFMHKGDISAKFDLMDLDTLNHVYALGALENLKGEILILDGNTYLSSQSQDGIQITNELSREASLIVYAQVPDWNWIDVPDTVQSYTEFEDYLEQMARANGLDVENPFPFLLKGEAHKVHWHVINWPEGDTVHTHSKHISSGLQGVLCDENVEILGFYSKNHHAIFTHHSTNMHLHVRTVDGAISGHADDIELGSSMQVGIPN